jgi:hypothetical protein
METHPDTGTPKVHSGEMIFDGKTFCYKVTMRTHPAKWADLEITNDRKQSITVFFNPSKQRLVKEIKRVLKLYKWIK